MPSSVTSNNNPKRLWWRLLSLSSMLVCVVMLARAEEGGMLAMAKNVPLGVENKMAVLPSFDVAGRRTSVITADVIRRVDNERLYAEKFVLEQFSKDPVQNVRVNLKTVYFNMQTSTLRSMERSKVTRSDFEIEGDNLIFDTKKNEGLMQGNIRTVIFDTPQKSGE